MAPQGFSFISYVQSVVILLAIDYIWHDVRDNWND